MQRKIIKQGNGSFTITLPKKWVEEYRISEETLIQVEKTERGIELTTEYKPKKKEIHINLQAKNSSSIRRIITTAYRTGNDIIIVNFTSEHNISTIQEIIKEYLIGFEMTHQEANKIIIENITEPSDEHFETILIKFLYSIKQIFVDIIEQLEQKKIVSVETLENQIIRYSNYLKRIISKTKKYNQSYWLFITLLNYAQRDAYHVHKNSEKKTKENITILKACLQCIEQIKNDYLKKIDNYENIHENLLHVFEIIENEKNKNKNTIQLYSAFRNIYHASNALSGIYST